MLDQDVLGPHLVHGRVGRRAIGELPLRLPRHRVVVVGGILGAALLHLPSLRNLLVRHPLSSLLLLGKFKLGSRREAMAESQQKKPKSLEDAVGDEENLLPPGECPDIIFFSPLLFLKFKSLPPNATEPS